MTRKLFILAVITLTVLVLNVAGAAAQEPANPQPPSPDSAIVNRGDNGDSDEDPCQTREPTHLDRRPEWRCVGLARFLDPSEEPTEPRELFLTEEEARALDREDDPRNDLGVAVSPDGRLYIQVRPTGRKQPDEMRAFNPDGRDGDPEREPSSDDSIPADEMGDASIQTVFGSDNREIRLSTTAYPWRALGAILPPGSTTSNCSGVLVGPRHVLTAGHCIHQDGNWFPNRKFAPGMRGVGEFSNGLKNHVWYYSVVGWFENADPRYDYAMIILEDQTNTANLGWFGWKSSGHTGSVWNFGYPIWSYACAASPIEITNWCWNYLYGDDGNILNVHWGQLGYRIDTQGGHSGSPVYKYNGGDRRVVAVHAYGGTIRNWGTRIRSAVSGNICDWIGNHPSAFANHGCY